MSIISELYDSFSALMNLRWGPTKSLKTDETHSSATVNEFNSFPSIKKLQQCITSLMLLNNASIEHWKRASAFSAAEPRGATFPDKARNDDILKVVTYSKVSSIMEQSEKSERSTISVMTASSGGGSS